MLCWAIQGPEVHFGFEFDCLLGVLVHARIDMLTCPHFWSLLPSSVFDWVVIAVSICDAMTSLNTLLHPVIVTWITLHAIFTGLSSFWLVPVSTVPDVEGLHLRKHIAARVTHCHSHVAHITHTHTHIYIYIYMYVYIYIYRLFQMPGKQLYIFVVSILQLSLYQQMWLQCFKRTFLYTK